MRRRMKPPSSARSNGCPDGVFPTRSNHAARDGVSVTAKASDARSDTTIVTASARKKTPGTPSRKASGTKTITGPIVDPTSGFRIPRTGPPTARRAVEEEPDRRREAAQRHEIEAHFPGLHREEGHQHRCRDHRDRDER